MYIMTQAHRLNAKTQQYVDIITQPNWQQPAMFAWTTGSDTYDEGSEL